MLGHTGQCIVMLWSLLGHSSQCIWSIEQLIRSYMTVFDHMGQYTLVSHKSGAFDQ